MQNKGEHQEFSIKKRLYFARIHNVLLKINPQPFRNEKKKI